MPHTGYVSCSEKITFQVCDINFSILLRLICIYKAPHILDSALSPSGTHSESQDVVQAVFVAQLKQV